LSVGSLDITALQNLYGANTTTNAGDTVYELQSVNETGTGYMSIWDVGGNDTIRHSGSDNATINLTPASLLYAADGGGLVSHVESIWGGFTIAHDVIIENAIGGSGNDLLTGNSANNILIGNEGDDVISSGAGNDLLYASGRLEKGGADVVRDADSEDELSGGADNDELWGDLGDDQLTGGLGADIFHETAVASGIGRGFGIASGNGRDTITDYSYADGDSIDLLGETSDYSFRNQGDDLLIVSHYSTEAIFVVQDL
jgi:serralysin